MSLPLMKVHATKSPPYHTCQPSTHVPTLPDVSMKRIPKSKSRTSLLADLIATDDESEHTANTGSTNDIESLVRAQSLRDTDPKTMLHELLGDFFIDADVLVKKELLGEGGFAVVHRCVYYDPIRQEEVSVAMKALKPDLFENLDDLREFVMEASLQRKLRHKNIVRSVGIGATDCTSMSTMRRSMFILQEYVPGKSLKEMVIQQMCNRSKRVYSMKSAVGWLLDIASALHYLHDVCRPMIIHRDLKLDNILLSEKGKRAKLCDFGLHKRIRTQGNSEASFNDTMDDSYYGGMLYQSVMERLSEYDPSLDSGVEHSLVHGTTHVQDLALPARQTLSESVMRSSQSFGTHAHARDHSFTPDEKYFSERAHRKPSRMGFTGKVGSIVYMAPEVFLNKPYNEKVDVFSFGVMMYELLAQTNIAVRHGMQQNHGPLNEYAERVANGFRETIPSNWPEYVKMLISECWDQNPRNRPSFKDIAHRLTFIHDSGIAENMGRPLINMNAIPVQCCCIQ